MSPVSFIDNMDLKLGMKF